MMYNTGNPVGSDDARDFIDDVVVVDNFTTLQQRTSPDRLGVQRNTLFGIEQEGKDAAEAMGWFPVAGSFEAGGTITARDQVLHYAATGAWYSWRGALPKTVAAGSTPATSGGFGPTGWIDRTDATLRTQLLKRPLRTAMSDIYGLADHVSVKDYGAIGDGTLHTLQEWVDSGRFSGLAAIQVAYPKVTSLTQSIDWAAIQTCADVAIGGEFLCPKGNYVITQTVVVPTGTTMRGQGKFDIWADDLTKGTCVSTSGAGNPQRWTDITGTDAADDTPMFVAGGPGVYFKNIALRSDTWSVGLFFPGVKRCGFREILALGFTDACVYLDATWSGRNTTLKTLHPEIDADDGMNEFSGSDFYLRATGPGAFGIKIQGTTRAGDSVPTATDWLWGWGGTSDIRFNHGRLSASGATGGCYSHDAQMFGVTSFGQGIEFTGTSFRLSGAAKYYAKFDRSARHVFVGSYGETGGSENPVVSITSRTIAGNGEIILIPDDLNGQMEIDGVIQGSISSRSWHNTRTISRIGADGRLALPGVHSVGTVNSSLPLQFTTFHEDGLFDIGWDDGTTRYQLFRGGKTFFRPETALGAALGTSSFPWSQANTARVTYTGDLTIDPTGVLNLAGTSINATFVFGDALTPVIRPLVDGGASIGTTTFLWQNGRFHNLYSDSGTVSVSDIRKKKDYQAIPDAHLDVWGSISWIRYKLIDGTSDRWHTGSIAQWICDAFTAAGLDATEYGLVCYESWPAKPAVVEVAATYDEDGNELTPHTRAEPAVEAGDAWYVRYEEMLAFEAAWNRRELARTKVELDDIKARLAALEAK